MKILITGIHGFVGANLVNRLKSSCSIYGLDIVCPHTDGIIKTFSWNELSELPDVDCVIHLAGKAHDTKNIAQSDEYFEINTGLAQKIYDWFIDSKAKKFIFFSSVKAVADKVLADKLYEDVVPAPVGPYGESKLAAERYILSRADELSEKSVYILRPCMIHGAGNKGNLNLLYTFVSKGIPYPLGAFENKRSFCSIDNLCFIVESFIEKDVPTGVYNVADDEAISTNELISIISESIHRPQKIWKWNPGLIRKMASVGTKLRSPFNIERLQKLTENYVVSNQKIKDALGVDKLPVKAKDGLIETIKDIKCQ